DALEELLRDDLVGVHVGTRQRRSNAGVLHKGFHRSPLPSRPTDLGPRFWDLGGVPLEHCYSVSSFVPSYDPGPRSQVQRERGEGLGVEGPVADVNEVAGDGGGGSHLRTHQMRAPALALTALKVAVAGAGAALARLQNVRVHAEAHRAARL